MIILKIEKNIFAAFLLNLLFSIIEFVGGTITGSIAIVSDSIHDFGDALIIGIAYFLEKKSNKKPNKKHTYGYTRYSMVGSIITTVILLLGSLFVIYESIKRIIVPVKINYDGMIIFAIFGVIINFIASYITKEGDSLNQKAVNIHMLEDVLGWALVLIGSILMKITNISLIDPILSILVALFILLLSLKNLKKVIDVFLETTPKNVDIDLVKQKILEINGIIDVHHIHVRSVDGYSNIATLHIVLEEYDKKVKEKVREKLLSYDIYHSTIEIELKDETCEAKKCKLSDRKINKHTHSHDMK